MARVSAILIPGSQATISLPTLTTAVTELLGTNTLFVINGTQDVYIEFYSSKGGTLTATTSSYRIPANQQTTFDMGNANDTISVFASSSSAVCIKILSVQ